jgi:acyl dehydratase
MHVITSLDQARDLIGVDLGVTEWCEIDQDRISGFADVTGDHTWIHVDVDRARREGPYGDTIAHGYLTLSMVPFFCFQLYQLRTPGVRLNYGLDKVRFPQPVPVGSRLRGRAVILGVPEVPAGHQFTVRCTIEIEGEAKPACVAETIVLIPHLPTG